MCALLTPACAGLCVCFPGGHDPSWRGLKAVELYDPVQDVWKSGPMLPSALPFAGAGVPTRGQVYIIGGGGCCSAELVVLVAFAATACMLVVDELLAGWPAGLDGLLPRLQDFKL